MLLTLAYHSYLLQDPFRQPHQRLSCTCAYNLLKSSLQVHGMTLAVRHYVGQINSYKGKTLNIYLLEAYIAVENI